RVLDGDLARVVAGVLVEPDGDERPGRDGVAAQGDEVGQLAGVLLEDGLAGAVGHLHRHLVLRQPVRLDGQAGDVVADEHDVPGEFQVPGSKFQFENRGRWVGKSRGVACTVEPGTWNLELGTLRVPSGTRGVYDTAVLLGSCVRGTTG